MSSCLTCSSSVILRSGRNAGALFCHMTAKTRSADWECMAWTDGQKFGTASDAAFESPHHVQVNSGVASQFETKA